MNITLQFTNSTSSEPCMCTSVIQQYTIVKNELMNDVDTSLFVTISLKQYSWLGNIHLRKEKCFVLEKIFVISQSIHFDVVVKPDN